MQLAQDLNGVNRSDEGFRRKDVPELDGSRVPAYSCLIAASEFFNADQLRDILYVRRTRRFSEADCRCSF